MYRYPQCFSTFQFYIRRLQTYALWIAAGEVGEHVLVFSRANTLLWGERANKQVNLVLLFHSAQRDLDTLRPIPRWQLKVDVVPL
jgi:hypothetical protein